MRPDLIEGVVGAVIPVRSQQVPITSSSSFQQYIAAAGPFATAADLAKQLPTLGYQVLQHLILASQYSPA